MNLLEEANHEKHERHERHESLRQGKSFPIISSFVRGFRVVRGLKILKQMFSGDWQTPDTKAGEKA